MQGQGQCTKRLQINNFQTNCRALPLHNLPRSVCRGGKICRDHHLCARRIATIRRRSRPNPPRPLPLPRRDSRRAERKMPRTLEDAAIFAAPGVFVLLWSSGFVVAKLGLGYAEPLTFCRCGWARWSRSSWSSSSLDTAEMARPGWNGAQRRGRSDGARPLSWRRVRCHRERGVRRACRADRQLAAGADVDHRQPLFRRARRGAAVARSRARPRSAFISSCSKRWRPAARRLLGWLAAAVALFGITLGTLYQKRFGGGVGLAAGTVRCNTPRRAFVCLGAFAFETRAVHWTPQFLLRARLSRRRALARRDVALSTI